MSETNSGEAMSPHKAQQLQLTNELLHTFFEWRHKIMVRFFVTAGALIAAMGYILDSRTLENWLIIVPGVLGCVASFGATRLDRVNSSLMQIAYKHGECVEKEMLLPYDGLFCKLRERSENVDKGEEVSYRSNLRLLYIGAAVLFPAGLIIAIGATTGG